MPKERKGGELKRNKSGLSKALQQCDANKTHK